jgi:hypothetical protein
MLLLLSLLRERVTDELPQYIRRFPGGPGARGAGCAGWPVRTERLLPAGAWAGEPAGQGPAGPGCGSALVLAGRSGRPWLTGRSTMCTEKAVLGGYLGRGYPEPPAFGVVLDASGRPF